MGLSKVLFVNTSLLITITYLVNLAYKSFLFHLPRWMKDVFAVFVFIVGGWVTMLFSFEVMDNVLLDMRLLPLIFSVVFFKTRWKPLIVGVGIGLARLTISSGWGAIAGFITMCVLAVLAEALFRWYRKSNGSYAWKTVVIVLSIQVARTLLASVIGVVPFKFYMTNIAPYTLPIGIGFSFLFLFMIWDFQREKRRYVELAKTNRMLRVRTEQLRNVQTELEKKALQLQSTSMYKSEYLRHMTKELKVPLHRILALVGEQLIVESDEETQIRRAHAVHRYGGELLGLVNDILDLSKAEAGKLDLQLEPIPVREWFLQMEERLGFEAAKRGVVLRIMMEDDVPELVWTDSLRLGRVLHHVLDCFLRMKNEGTLVWHVGKADLPGGETGVSVRFRGKDCPHRTSLPNEGFEASMRILLGRNGSDGAEGGDFGLGLTLARQLAELLGGRISLEADEESCFMLLTLAVHAEQDGSELAAASLE